MDKVSVGATVTICAPLRWRRTIIENAAREPEIVDTANFPGYAGGEDRRQGTDRITTRA